MCQCQRCKKKLRSVKLYTFQDPEELLEEGVPMGEVELLPEDADEGFYCDACLQELRDEWWQDESEAYCDYNCDGCDYWDPEKDCLKGMI